MLKNPSKYIFVHYRKSYFVVILSVCKNSFFSFSELVSLIFNFSLANYEVCTV